MFGCGTKSSEAPSCPAADVAVRPEQSFPKGESERKGRARESRAPAAAVCLVVVLCVCCIAISN